MAIKGEEDITPSLLRLTSSPLRSWMDGTLSPWSRLQQATTLPSDHKEKKERAALLLPLSLLGTPRMSSAN